MNYKEFTGKTVEEAVEIGLKELGLTAEQADIRILEEGKKKLFGSVKARVELAAKEVAPVVEEVETTTVSCECADGATDGERTVAFLEGLFELLNITACTELVSEGEKVEINVTAANTTAIIGKHGSMLDAIQTLAGAVAVIDVNSGAVLAAASYPDYSLTTYKEDYAELVSDAGSPLWNRAFQSAYSPGSTMKPVIAIAALEEGLITGDSRITCTGQYNYLDQTFACFNKNAHGTINVKRALGVSCNIFFFDLARKLGINKMNEYSKLFGLGQKTGVEIYEEAGILAGLEYRDSIGQGWKPGETLLAAIGQSDNSFTPLQLANYCATIANGGTRYVPYLVSKVLSSDFSEVLYEKIPEVACETNVSQTTLDVVKEGMYLVANETSCKPYLGSLKYKVACKTGTAEKTRIVNGVTYEGTDGFLIAFGPYENAEIAIAVVIENAGSGSSTAQVAADIFEYYFSTMDTVKDVQTENTLLG